MKREDLPPWLTEHEKDLAMAEQRKVALDRRGPRRVGARDRRRGFRLPPKG